ncbi:MAG TPA: transcriptional regulator, partial [Methanocorpusculum sp.]|nr:transcriptional regulator [Methanocorpusculum sp.]
ADLCVLAAGTDLMEAPHLIYQAAAPLNIKIRYDSISLINRISSYMPEKIKGRHVREDIRVYLNTDGDLYFG